MPTDIFDNNVRSPRRRLDFPTRMKGRGIRYTHLKVGKSSCRVCCCAIARLEVYWKCAFKIF